MELNPNTPNSQDYQQLLAKISDTYTQAQARAMQAVKAQLAEIHRPKGATVPHRMSETQLETLLCDHLQPFMLELGKGFTFLGRQYRINVGGTHYRVDLVFYHRILRCFVLIDLKLGEVQHHDIGQMNLYMGYFAAEENTEGDNPPIGIIMSRHKDELLVEYATYGMNSQLFVQKYQLYLPDRDALKAEIERTLLEAGQ